MTDSFIKRMYFKKAIGFFICKQVLSRDYFEKNFFTAQAEMKDRASERLFIFSTRTAAFIAVSLLL